MQLGHQIPIAMILLVFGTWNPGLCLIETLETHKNPAVWPLQEQPSRLIPSGASTPRASARTSACFGACPLRGAPGATSVPLRHWGRTPGQGLCLGVQFPHWISTVSYIMIIFIGLIFQLMAVIAVVIRLYPPITPTPPPSNILKMIIKYKLGPGFQWGKWCVLPLETVFVAYFQAKLSITFMFLFH